MKTASENDILCHEMFGEPQPLPLNHNCHPAYALAKVRQRAEMVMTNPNCTANERILADCIIALSRGIRAHE